MKIVTYRKEYRSVTMEVIASVIRSSLVPFLTDKLAPTVEEDVIRQYIDEWLMDGKPGKPIRKRAPVVKNDNPVLTDPTTVLTTEEYQKLKVSELKVLCKARGLSTSNTKAGLIESLVGMADTKMRDDPIRREKTEDDAAKSSDEAEPKLKPLRKVSPQSRKNSGDNPKRKPVKKVIPNRVGVESHLSSSEDNDVVSVRKVSKKTEVSDSEEERPKRKLTVKKKPEVSDSEEEERPKRKLTVKKKTNVPKVIEKVSRHDFQLVKDKHGNLFHEETGLVFNDNNEAIGRKDEDKNIRKLTTKDVDICNKYNLSYLMDSDFDADTEIDE